MSSIGTGPHDPDLAALRAALKAMPAPAADEAALRRMFREHRAAAGGRARTRARGRRYWPLAAAVACVAAGGLVSLMVTARREPAAPSPPMRSSAAVAAFQPLRYAPEVVPGAAYNVVRVRIPLSSLALLPDAAADGMIEADLLVGEDGLARGIRFSGPGALLVSKATQ